MRIFTLALAALTVLVCALLGCGGSSESEPVSLTGVGATFPYPMYSKWFNEYRQVKPAAQINYQSLGSGAGVKQVTDGTVDFGASDQPLTEDQLAAFREKRGFNVLHFPTVLGAVVPTYNLPDIAEPLSFTPEALAGIFLGKITKWNDSAIASANPGVKLPTDEITVVHRSDGSGTTFIWTDYLSKVSPEWAAGPGKGTSVDWPVGLGAKGNEGVTGLVKQRANSIGYVEMIYASQNKLPAGKVRNAAGTFTAASLESVTAAAAGIEMPDDFRVSITNPQGVDAYPIASFTWLLIPEQIGDQAKREEIKSFLAWMLGPGQALTPALEFASLPASVVAKETAALASIH